MLQFAKRLASKGLRVSLVTFCGNKSMEIKAKGSVKLEPVFDDLGADSVMEKSIDDYLGRLEAVVALRLPQIMARLGMSKSSCLVYDSVLSWALDIAKQQGVYGAEFFTFSCAVSTIYYNLHQGLIKVPVVEPCLSMAGLPLLRPHDLPSFVSDIEAYPTLTHLLTNQFSSFKKADWVFFNTFTRLENEVVKWMAYQRPIKTIGPTVPSKYLDNRVDDDNDYGINLFKPELDICANWLNSKQTGSVVYVSFGSLAAPGGDQMEELAMGLKRSGRNFLWVVRESEQKKIPANFVEETSEKGLVVSWSPQLEVLSHKSVGCFMSHCGWNSTIEALSLGVPMVALPQWTDQTTNAKFIVDIWRVGIRAEIDGKGIIGKEEIERCIREVMEGDGSEEMKRNAMNWKKLTTEAVSEGGSSDNNIIEFIAQLTCKPHA
ncbi:formin-like proteiny 2 domain-containing family protein [Hibiscus syriacus]|uniref:Glycosyltransferase n=2 Tax=Hibiscus syriacus TaxID=106335 RepID=A0A6A2XXF3_HIBSY|nr:formin-like proteiny 2 domain-containing family protein [Hibiscus syriacus]